MTFLRGLLSARGHLAFLAGLLAAFVVAREADRLVAAPARGAADGPAPAAGAPLRPQGGLDARELALARAAWSYFERHADPVTGLVPAVKGHRATTLWDLGSQLAAVLAAEDLGLVSGARATRLLGRAIASIGRLPLCEGTLPNKAYDVHTLALSTADGRAEPICAGWSALDVARLLGPLSLVARRHPELARATRDAVSEWRLDALTDGGSLRGTARGPDGRLVWRQEGRLGYEQLAAKDLLVWGLPVAPLLDLAAHATPAEVEGVALLRDDRDPLAHGGARAPLLSEPWVLDALEHGLDARTLPLARALLSVQERRFQATGRLTAVSEDHLDRPPWFTYSSIVDGEATWSARDAAGAPAPDGLTFSTKAAVAWGVLFAGDYPDRLLAAAAALIAPGEGVYAGRYDGSGEVNRALSLNTNAVVLEAIAYRLRGPARAPRPRLSAAVEARR